MSRTAAKLPPLTEGQRALAEGCWRLALRVARDFATKYGEGEDFEGAVAMAVCRAAARFDPGLGTRFSTFAYHACVSACLDVLRTFEPAGYRRRNDKPAAWNVERRRRAPAVGSLSAVITKRYDGAPVLLEDAIVAEQDPVGWELDWEERVEDLSRRAPKGHGRVIRLLYLHAAHGTMAKVGTAVGLTEGRVSQIHAETVRRVREVLQGQAGA